MNTDFLNHENIQNSSEIEFHPLKPFLPQNAKILFLGSFPPPRKRWCMNFYYPNFMNDHWRILGAIFYDDKNYFVDLSEKKFRYERIVSFVEDKGFAYFDTATSVRRLKNNASDKFLDIVQLTNLDSIISRIPQCRTIVTTGEKATQNVCDYFSLATIPSVGESMPIPNRIVALSRLPSSSRAYPISFERKVRAYGDLFEKIGLVF